MKMKFLKENEATIKNELRSLSQVEGRALTTEEVTRSNELIQELDNIQASIALEERASQFAANEVVVEEVKQEVSKVDAYEAYIRNGSYGLNPEVRANLVSTSDANGGYIVPDEFESSLYKNLKHYVSILGVCNFIQTSHGRSIDMPTLDETTVTAGWGAESALVSPTDMTFANVAIGANMLRSMVLLSIELIQDNDVNIVGQLSGIFADRFGRALQAGLTNGDGTGANPTGYMNNITTGVTAAATDAITRDDIVDLIHSVDEAYRANPSFRIVMNDATLAAVRKLAFGTGDDRPLYQVGNATLGEPDTIEGVPVMVNPAMPNIGASANPIAVCDFSKFVVRQAGGYSFRRLDERYADNLQVAFLGYTRFDSAVLDAAAFRALTMAAA